MPDLSGVRELVLQNLPALRDTASNLDNITLAFMLRDWMTSIACYANDDLLIDHLAVSPVEVLCRLIAYRGGLWCGGVASTFAAVLNAMGVPAAVFSYGLRGVGLTHDTTIFGVPREQTFDAYLLDAYLAYHYEDSMGLLPFTRLLALIRDGCHNEIRRKDKTIHRPYVICQGEDPAFGSWLFDNGVPPRAEKKGNLRVYQGASHSIGKLMLNTSPMRHLVDKYRGETPMGIFLLKLMLKQMRFSWFSSSRDFAWSVAQRALWIVTGGAVG